MEATSPDITHGLVWWVSDLAATWRRYHFGSVVSQNATGVCIWRRFCIGDVFRKYKDYNAESLTQTPAVSPVRPCIVNVMDNFNTERFIIIEVLKRPLLWDTSAAEYLFTICRNIFSNHHINYKIVHFQSDRQ
jgi:hypothetical protein